MPGSRVVPAATENAPAWLLGPWRGLGIDAAAGSNGALIFFLGLVLAFALYVAVFCAARRMTGRALAAAVVFCQLALALAPPLISQDVFSYIAYARLGAEHGLNPYAHVPAEMAGDPVFAYVGWRQAASAYGSLFTLATYPLGKLGVPAALWLLKALTVAASLAIVALVWRAARVLSGPTCEAGVSPAVGRGVSVAPRSASRAVALVGLNPAVVVSVVGGAHNDAFAVLAGMAGVLALLAGRSAVAGAWGVLGAQVKSSLALVGGFLVLGAQRRLVALLGAVTALAVLAAISLAIFGGDVTGALTAAGENQERTSFYSVPNQTARLLAAITGTPGADLVGYLRAGFAAALLIVVAWLAVRVLADRTRWLASAGWATFALLIATAWLLPWYLLWLLPLAALAGDRRLTIATLALTAYTLPIRVPL